VIACDQFTSQEEYWQQVRELVGNAPSTLNLILPEVYLGKDEEKTRIQSTKTTMRQYLDEGLLAPNQSLVYVERSVDGKTRHGMMLALDLERYDFSKGSQSLIRATEGTILDRLPPRMRIREGASLELPHILVLIDDPDCTVIEPLTQEKSKMAPLYDTDLMLGSGHLSGYLAQPEQEARVVAALRKLATPTRFQQKYNVGPEHGVLLFAVGDGNHSLATAKSIWEKIKQQVGPDHPARYALVEIENVHDAGLTFEPIHRVLFGVKQDFMAALKTHYGEKVQVAPVASQAEMIQRVQNQGTQAQAFGLISEQGTWVVSVTQSGYTLPVGVLQSFLDTWAKQGGFESIDYVHGDEVVSRLGSQKGNLGVYLPAMQKSDLFRTVIIDGVLPRKTFSMGEAKEKRFYMECRRIDSSSI
jgi:hypothetical protein